MKTMTAAVLLGLASAMAHAQEKAVPVGEQQVYKTVNGQELHLWVARPSGNPTHTAIVFFHGAAGPAER